MYVKKTIARKQYTGQDLLFLQAQSQQGSDESRLMQHGSAAHAPIDASPAACRQNTDKMTLASPWY
jgi:hypothetical protein